MNNETITVNGALIIALSRSFQTIHRDSELLFHRAGLTMPQFAVMEALLHKGDMTVGALIDAVLSSSGNMTVVIRNLERRGWVRRLENPADRRSFLIRLTEEGDACIRDLFPRHMALVEQALLHLTAAEKETIITLLKKLQ